jgi:hypothetical protein
MTKIDAIKLVRRITGFDLKHSKFIVEIWADAVGYQFSTYQEKRDKQERLPWGIEFIRLMLFLGKLVNDEWIVTGSYGKYTITVNKTITLADINSLSL